MGSFLLKSLLQKPLTFTAARNIPRVSFPTMSSSNPPLRSYYGDNSPQPKEDDRICPVYIHHVSKIVLQHLQDNRTQWLMDQGLDRGLHIKSNGTFLLKFPARKGFDAGKIWTSYDASTREHWISVYRQKFNAKFLLKKGRCKVLGKAKMEDEAHKIMSEANEIAEMHIRAVVDQLVLQIPPQISASKAAPEIIGKVSTKS